MVLPESLFASRLDFFEGRSETLPLSDLRLPVLPLPAERPEREPIDVWGRGRDDGGASEVNDEGGGTYDAGGGGNSGGVDDGGASGVNDDGGGTYDDGGGGNDGGVDDDDGASGVDDNGGGTDANRGTNDEASGDGKVEAIDWPGM